MSAAWETTPKSEALSHAETRADRQPEICRKLAHKAAVMTGGSTGMEGADHVFITGHRKNVLGQAVAEIGEKAIGIPGDVASRAPRPDRPFLASIVLTSRTALILRLSKNWPKHTTNMTAIPRCAPRFYLATGRTFQEGSTLKDLSRSQGRASPGSPAPGR